jgi:hypothetical protein
MQRFLVFFAVVCLLQTGNALKAQDTLAYEVQRQRVNELLNQRSARFGEFNKSLEARTGIFGFKTKKDMQASIDILKEIVQTDNHIFKETKVLIDYKDMEKTFISSQNEQSTARINGYVNTISKLEKHQEALNLSLLELENRYNRLLVFSLFSGIALISLLAIILKRKFQAKRRPLP